MTAIKRDGFRKYKRVQVSELRPYVEGEDITSIGISPFDKENGSPKLGDMIARNPNDHNDKWLVAAAYFQSNFKIIEEFVSLANGGLK